MKEHTEQHLDKLSKKVMQSSPLDSPSNDFTRLVMSRVQEVSIESTFSYTPLISKKAWIVILGSIIAIVAFTLFSNMEASGWSNQIDFSVLSNNRLNEFFSGITISKTLTYGIGVLGLLWLVQVPLLKYQFNKRLDY